MVGFAVLFVVVAGGVAVHRRVGADDLRDGLARLYPRKPLRDRKVATTLYRAARRTVSVGVSGQAIVPGVIEVRVHPDDVVVFRDALRWVGDDIATRLRSDAQGSGWTLPDPAAPRVEIHLDPERPVRRPLGTGRFCWPSSDGTDAVTEVLDPTVDADGIDLHLVGVADPSSDLRIHVPAVGVVVGRADDVDVVVHAREVSRRHCRLYAGSGGICVDDLGSRNGTRVQGRRVEVGETLHDGDVLSLGLAEWRVVL